MPMRSNFLELCTWREGGPAGELAFSSLTPAETVQRQEKKLRWTPHMSMMRKIMAGQGSVLGQPLSRLLTERARCTESEIATSKVQTLHREISRYKRPSVVKRTLSPLAGKSLAGLRGQKSDEGLDLWGKLEDEPREGPQGPPTPKSPPGAGTSTLDLRELEDAGELGGDGQPSSSDSSEEEVDETPQTMRSIPPAPVLSRCGSREETNSNCSGQSPRHSISRISLVRRLASEDGEAASQAPRNIRATLKDKMQNNGNQDVRESLHGLGREATLSVLSEDGKTPKGADQDDHRASYRFGRKTTFTINKAAKKGSRAKIRASQADGKGSGEQKKAREKGPLPFRVISWSSQKRSYRCAAQNLEPPSDQASRLWQLAELESGASMANQWETDAAPEHFLFLDFGMEAEITRVKLRCTGTLYDPKSVTVMRAVIGVLEVVEEHNRLAEEAQRSPEASAVNTLALITKGTWAVIARASLKSGPQARDRHSHTLRFPPVRTRFLRITFHESHSASGNMRLLQPLVVYGKLLRPPVPARKLSTTIMFHERWVDEMERSTRKLARKYRIPIDYTETVLKEFTRYDTENRGFLNFTDFKCVVRALTYRHLGQKQDVMLQDSHLRALWNIVDRDGSGCVDFEEFLQWFYSHFQKEKPPARSLHCDRMVDSVTEHFYASMGVNRLRCYAALEPEPGHEDYQADKEHRRADQAALSAVKKAWLRNTLAAASGH